MADKLFHVLNYGDAQIEFEEGEEIQDDFNEDIWKKTREIRDQIKRILE